MGMPKFFFDKIDMTQGQICLHGEDEKHIKTVLRAKEGEELTERAWITNVEFPL